MRVTVSSSGDWSNTMAWLDRVKNRNAKSTLESIGQEGSKALKNATPKRTGITAAAWKHEVVSEKNGLVLYWFNDAYPNLTVNVASLINWGHGTGTGGFVPANPFISKTLESILSKGADRIVKELIK